MITNSRAFSTNYPFNLMLLETKKSKKNSPLRPLAIQGYCTWKAKGLEMGKIIQGALAFEKKKKNISNNKYLVCMGHAIISREMYDLGEKILYRASDFVFMYR